MNLFQKIIKLIKDHYKKEKEIIPTTTVIQTKEPVFEVREVTAHPLQEEANRTVDNLLAVLQNKVDLAQASELAAQSHLAQNKQIDEYYLAILRKKLDPFFFELYCGKDKAPIPGLSAHIEMIQQLIPPGFGRRVVMKMGIEVIGDATFMVYFENGHPRFDIKETIPRA